MNQKENLGSDTCVIMLDFAENYHYVLQMKLHPMHHSLSCHYNDVSNVLQKKLFGLIPEELKHDTAFVYDVISKVCECVKGNYMHIIKVKYFSNGCAVQYKNYKNFLNFCHHYSDFDLEVERNFFTTSHGKSANKIGGIIKQCKS